MPSQSQEEVIKPDHTAAFPADLMCTNHTKAKGSEEGVVAKHGTPAKVKDKEDHNTGTCSTTNRPNVANARGMSIASNKPCMQESEVVMHTMPAHLVAGTTDMTLQTSIEAGFEDTDPGSLSTGSVSGKFREGTCSDEPLMSC